MKVPVLLSALLCRSCQGTPNDYYEAPTLYQLYDVPVSSSGTARPMVSLDVEKVNWRQKEKGIYVAFASATIQCPDCRKPHNLQQELEAPRILLEMAGKCRSCQGLLSLTQESIEYTDRGEGEPKIEVSGLLVCQDCVQKTSIGGEVTSKDLPEILERQELKLKVDESRIRLPDMKVHFADIKPIGMHRHQNPQSLELRIYLCHSSDDKPAIRNLYNRMRADGYQPWFDEENLIPGQDWNLEIQRALRDSEVILICLSRNSLNKEGYIQKEIKRALQVAEEKPEGTIFVIPVKLDECELPENLSRWHYVDLRADNGYAKLCRALNERANSLTSSTQDRQT